MARKATGKTEIVAFKVEAELAEFLDKLPNKSEFIRKAILAQFGMTCPLCSGSGVVPRGIHVHFEPILKEHNERPCDKCKKVQTFPMTLEGLSEDERPRIEQFFHGGPLYCESCYHHVPACEDCGWHIPIEQALDHHRRLHSS